MAKSAAKRNTASGSRIESAVVDYAEELGRMLGTVRARVDKLERNKLVRQLSTVVKDAQSRLKRLTKSPRRTRKTTKKRKAGG
jgi:hypothetical protein